MRRRILLPGVAFVLAGCEGPLSALQSAGPIAAEIAFLWWVMLAGSGLLTLMVVVMLALSWGRPRDTSAKFWTHGMGLFFSLTILTSLLGVGLWVGERIIPRDDTAVTVEANAWQWGWTFRHEGLDGVMVESDDLLHIPAGQPVDVLITSDDVIHSFWIPQLAGKMDAIPGRTNRLRIFADAPGQYEGVCAEFCGVGHAMMQFSVLAHDQWPPILDETEAAQ